jgi:nicotinate-nucleotide pyrophosphorylase (carboxylating)
MSDPNALGALVARALAEDVGAGDITSDAVVAPDTHARARLVQKQPGVVFGLDAAQEVFRQAGADTFERLAPEGDWREEVPADVALAAGPAHALLAAERTALNLIGHLSGIATLTARYARELEGYEAELLDTRKTTPGLRALEKAAVAAGGGRNHRMGLHDAILIKENHVAEIAEALDARADRLLLDNMSAEELRDAVAARDAAARAHGPVATLEASGGITLDNVRGVAGAGIDFVSVGALTHSAPALDLSMLLEAATSAD